MFDIGSDKTRTGRRQRLYLVPFASALAALALVAVFTGVTPRSTEAAGSSSGLGQPQTVMNDYYNDCAPFSSIGTYYDPFGSPYYQPLPINGNPFTMYNQCINYGINGYGLNNCIGYGYASCANYCVGPSPDQYSGYSQVCSGPPASILISPSPTSVTCGGASNLEVVVLDANGQLVTNGTNVSFNTSLGYISTMDGTQRGKASTSLTIPPKQSGQAVVTATAGSATAQKLIQVTC